MSLGSEVKTHGQKTRKLTGDDGSEDFLAHDLGVFRNVGEDGGLNEVTLVTAAGTALDEGSFGLADFDVL